MAKEKYQPKTHSDILWHFTGGPAWSIQKQKQNKKRKSDKASYEILLAILKSQEIRLGGYHEIFKVEAKESKRNNLETGKLMCFTRPERVMKTAKVCCLADIPFSEISFHAERYGKFAIGFKRSSVIRAGFNPVLYTLNSESIAENYMSAFEALSAYDDFGMQSTIDDVQSLAESEFDEKIADLPDYFSDEMGSLDLEISDLEYVAEEINELVINGLKKLTNVMSYVKTFDSHDFEDIYSEREWRSLDSFNFSKRDVAAIILPRKGGYINNFENLRNKIPVVPKRLRVKKFEDSIIEN